jgi:hypothetical protein
VVNHGLTGFPFASRIRREFGVIGLPDGIWAFGAMPVHQFVTVAERCLTLVGEREHRWIEPRIIV